MSILCFSDIISCIAFSVIYHYLHQAKWLFVVVLLYWLPSIMSYEFTRIQDRLGIYAGNAWQNWLYFTTHLNDNNLKIFLYTPWTAHSCIFNVIFILCSIIWEHLSLNYIRGIRRKELPLSCTSASSWCAFSFFLICAIAFF